jgi:hypothetical protein
MPKSKKPSTEMETRLNISVGMPTALPLLTPESFPLMKNVILENIRTAENMLIAYERVMAGESETLDLIAYSHGDKGREQFKKNRKKYISKR